MVNAAKCKKNGFSIVEMMIANYHYCRSFTGALMVFVTEGHSNQASSLLWKPFIECNGKNAMDYADIGTVNGNPSEPYHNYRKIRTERSGI